MFTNISFKQSSNILHLSIGKVKLSLSLIRHHSMKLYAVVEVQFHTIYLQYHYYGGKWSVSHSGCFILRENSQYPHWVAE